MEAGQRVRVRASSQLAREWNIPSDAKGTVICRYRLLRERQVGPVRLDVRFSSRLVLWGVPDCEFEAVES
jgi:hypothetical protein